MFKTIKIKTCVFVQSRQSVLYSYKQKRVLTYAWTTKAQIVQSGTAFSVRKGQRNMTKTLRKHVHTVRIPVNPTFIEKKLVFHFLVPS